MTITRKYYNTLLELFSKLCILKESDVLDFIETKREISNLIERISKFNLFPLTFSDSFFFNVHSKKIHNFQSEKILLVNELHYELSECLHTTRLRYGGELIDFTCKIKLALLNLSILELAEFENVKKIPEHYYFPEQLMFKTIEEKKEKIKEVKLFQKKHIIKQEKVTIKQTEFKAIESKLTEIYSTYKNYIIENYPSIANHFSFYNKSVRVYITQAMPKDIFEFRFHSYSTNTGQSSLTLLYQYYDFYPSYFYNLEEISDKQYTASIVSLDKKTLDFSNPLSIKNIHWDLVNIFIRHTKENEITNFVSFLLKCDGYRIYNTKSSIDLGFDLMAEKGNDETFVEIFHKKPRSLKDIDKRISAIKKGKEEKKCIFFFTTFPGIEVYEVLKNNKIVTLGIHDLLNKINHVDNMEIVHWFIKSKLPEIELPEEDNIIFQGEDLKRRLENCPAGDKNWSEYEDLGIQVFRFLFEDNFKKYIAVEQFENDLKNHRRDLIVSNYYNDSSSFWAEVKSEYKCKAIIIDFKNYSDKLNSSTLFSVSKYSNKKVGYFAIVFSRKGIDKTAKNEQKTLLSEGKLLIEFNDVELIEMINEKMFGKDPLDRLKSKEFELLRL